jgi:hypothetical protein
LQQQQQLFLSFSSLVMRQLFTQPPLPLPPPPPPQPQPMTKAKDVKPSTEPKSRAAEEQSDIEGHTTFNQVNSKKHRRESQKHESRSCNRE